MKGNLLELGIWEGGSTNSYKLFLPHFDLYGIDERVPQKTLPAGTKFYQGKQEDTTVLQKAVDDAKSFKVIIDDGGHWAHHQQPSFTFLIDYLDDDGIYIIEDLQVANERNDPPFESTVEFLKKLPSKYNVTFYPTQRSETDLCVIRKEI
jgi:hypothetical protein